MLDEVRTRVAIVWSVAWFSPPKNKNSLDRKGLCQGRIKPYPRCHLDSRLAVRLQDTDISSATNVCHTLQNTGRAPHAVDCTLRGPFDDLFLARFSPSRALWKALVAFISASTVCFIALIVSLLPPFVKGNLKKHNFVAILMKNRQDFCKKFQFS